jgi:hypothetical protein
MYLLIMIANLYVSLRPHDSPLPSPSPSRRRANRNGSSGVQTGPDMAQLPAPRDSLVDPSGEPPPPYTARPGQGESIAVAPTSHPAIDRVAASRAADVDVERLAGADHNDPCVEYETLDRTRMLMGAGIGIDLSTVDASSSPTSSTPTTSTEAGPSTLARMDSTQTLATQPSIISLIASTDAARRAIDSSSTTSLVTASASPGTSPRIPQRVSSTTASAPAAS